MQLSKNFSLVEMTKSQTAIRAGLANNPSEGEEEQSEVLYLPFTRVISESHPDRRLRLGHLIQAKVL